MSPAQKDHSAQSPSGQKASCVFYIAKRYFRGHSGGALHVRATENEIKSMTEEAKPKPLFLTGEKALDLWRQGRDAWNRKIDRQKVEIISFTNVDFAAERYFSPQLSFAGYHFGNGDVKFSGVTFGDGEIDFSKATFGDGEIDFSGVTFGKGKVNFSNATFGKGDVNFTRANFGIGDVNFTRTSFGNGDLNFSRATFSGGKVIFSRATLRDGEVNFSNATFDDCTIFLNETKFSQLRFRPKAIKSSHIRANGLSIKNLAVLFIPLSAERLEFFDLHGASFDGPLIVSGNLDIVPDLRDTKFSHQVELSRLSVKLRRAWQGFSWLPKLYRVTEDPTDSSRLRRLKEIAETNKDHQAALRFSADENRARRWIETSWFGSVLDMAFSACSNYGQSILRPFVALFLLTAASIGLYKKLAVTADVEWWTGLGWGQSLLLSISNSLPFLPQSRELRKTAQDALYSNDPSFWVDALMIGQGVFSFAFLFLIGLGLRNRFRL
tara:strand:+ start:47367 stop:48848 length:1482 start_codon:yes stop_codon:yes gene_type:complete